MGEYNGRPYCMKCDGESWHFKGTFDTKYYVLCLQCQEMYDSSRWAIWAEVCRIEYEREQKKIMVC